jgi:phosphate transport system substrate-binding protein
MNTRICSLLLFLVIVLCGCKPKEKEPASPAPPERLSGKITITGAYALYPLVVNWADEFIKLHPDVKINVEGSGTGLGIDDLLSGESQIAMVSRELTDDERGDSLVAIPVTKDAVVLIINRTNPYLQRLLTQGIDIQKLDEIFIKNTALTWGKVLSSGSKEPIHVFTRSDVSGAAEMWANFLFKTQEDLLGTKVTGDEEMISSIQKDKYAIGYCNLSYAYDRNTGDQVENIQVVPIDLDFDGVIDKTEQPYLTIQKIHRAIWLGLYPRNLCRKLTLVTKGVPTDPLVKEFINWVMTDGQAMVEKNGYCPLNNVELRNATQVLTK